MRVAFEPFWGVNPYQTQLMGSLRSLGVELLSPEPLKSLYARCIAGTEELDVLHVHALPYVGLSPIEVGRYVMFYWRLDRFRKRGTRLVWTVHDFRNHDTKYWWIEDRIARLFSLRMDALIVHGRKAKEIIESQWKVDRRRRIFIIPHGHFIDSYRNDVTPEAARASLGLTPSNLVFLFLGLIRPYKGVVEMVEAFRGYADPNARLVIAGRPVAEAISNEVERSIQGDSRIRFFPGHIKDDEVQKYMNACDAVLLPYRRVLTSGVAVLAMSFGKPCIAPRAGCITDMLDEEGAVFFDPLIHGDLERAMQTISACRQKLKAMGEHNLRRIASWDWASIGRATATVYDQCVTAEKRQFVQPLSVFPCDPRWVVK
jgi:beta-1,4-mannosyltransferase